MAAPWKPSSADMVCPTCHQFKNDPRYRVKYRHTSGNLRERHECPKDDSGQELVCSKFNQCPLKQFSKIKAEKAHAKELAEVRKKKRQAAKRANDELKKREKEDKEKRQRTAEFKRVPRWEAFKQDFLNKDDKKPLNSAHHFNQVSDAAREYLVTRREAERPTKRAKLTKPRTTVEKRTQNTTTDVEDIAILYQVDEDKNFQDSDLRSEEDDIKQENNHVVDVRSEEESITSDEANTDQPTYDFPDNDRSDLVIMPEKRSNTISGSNERTCYCGNLPTVAVAQKTGRKFLGCTKGYSGCGYFRWLDTIALPNSTDMNRVLFDQGEKIDKLATQLSALIKAINQQSNSN